MTTLPECGSFDLRLTIVLTGAKGLNPVFEVCIHLNTRCRAKQAGVGHGDGIPQMAHNRL